MPALGNIDELVETIGYTAFETLVSVRGGRRLYVTKSIDAAAQLVQWIGPDKAAAMVEVFGGFAVDIPNRQPTTLPTREPVIVALIEAGRSNEEIVDLVKCTERSVRRYRAKVDARPGRNPSAAA